MKRATEICVTFDKETTTNGYEKYHFFPIEFIIDRHAMKTALFKSVLKNTGSAELAIRFTEWAQGATVNESLSEGGVNASLESWCY